MKLQYCTVALFLFAVPAGSQTPGTSIEAAALADVRKDLPKGQIVIDDAVLAATGTQAKKRFVADNRALAATIPGSVVESGKPHATCTNWKNWEGCKLDVAAVVSLTAAKIVGDTAQVVVSVVTPPNPNWKGFDRVDYMAKLVKRGTAWVVVERWISGIT